MFSINDGSFKSFENGTAKLLAKETKWASLEVRTHPTFLETLISKYDFRPVMLPGLSRNGPQLPVINEPVKLFCFPVKMRVSKVLKIVHLKVIR